MRQKKNRRPDVRELGAKTAHPKILIMELTDADKDRIKAEEIYRDEARRAISEQIKQPFRARFTAFLNSPFCLWLLSTVVVGLVTWKLTRITQESERKFQNQQMAERLKREIFLHAGAFCSQIKRATSRLEYETVYSDILQTPQPLLFDYKIGSIDRYLYELMVFGDSEDQRKAAKAHTALTEIWEVFDNAFKKMPDSKWMEALPPETREPIDAQITAIIDNTFLNPFDGWGLKGAALVK